MSRTSWKASRLYTLTRPPEGSRKKREKTILPTVLVQILFYSLSLSLNQGVLHLVDLAGSERLDRSGVGSDAQRLKETQNINKSLSCLADVFSALSAKASHIPFRNSKLTYLMQVRGGNWLTDCEAEGGEGTFSFVACRSLLTIDHASLSRRSTVPTRDTSNIWGGAYSCLAMHGRSRMTIDPRIPTMPGQSTSGYYCLHQARTAVRCSGGRKG